MRLAIASTVAFVIGYGWFLAGGAECDRADCGWLAELFYETLFVGSVLLIAAVCGLAVAAIRGMFRWHRLRSYGVLLSPKGAVSSSWAGSR